MQALVKEEDLDDLLARYKIPQKKSPEKEKAPDKPVPPQVPPSEPEDILPPTPPDPREDVEEIFAYAKDVDRKDVV